MSFGKNPYVAKAQAAELLADRARDEIARTRAHREAAHEWERAADREKPGKRHDEYVENAKRQRELADACDGVVAESDVESRFFAGAEPDPTELN
jgi:hypothetical protein